MHEHTCELDLAAAKPLFVSVRDEIQVLREAVRPSLLAGLLGDLAMFDFSIWF